MKSISRAVAYWRSDHATVQHSIWRQAVEMLLLYLFRRIGPGYYIQARWGRKSISFRDKWNHMNRYEYLEFIARWNPKEYQKASQHKLVEKATLTLCRLPSAAFVGYVHHLRGRTAMGEPLQQADHLDALMRQHIGKRLCFKRAEGFGGFGFASYVIDFSSDGLRLVDQSNQQALEINEWWQQKGEDKEGFLIEEYLHQHPAMARLNASSINTVRFWVVCIEGMREIVGCYLRLGRASSQVDNISSGGLVCTLDPDTGVILELLDPRQSSRTLSQHPDSNLVVAGLQLPDWEQAKRLAMDAVSVFPHIKVVGLDIAFVEAGPVVIELNVCPDYVGCARMDLPLRHLEKRMRATV